MKRKKAKALVSEGYAQGIWREMVTSLPPNGHLWSLRIDFVHTGKVLSRGREGFSLLELLAVLGIMALLLGISLPSLLALTNQAGRKGAVTLMLNTFAQARAAALEKGTNVYVGFADSNFPDENMQWKAFIIFRKTTDEEKQVYLDRTPPEIPPDYAPLTKWELLPQGIKFKSERLSIVGDGTDVPKQLDINPGSLPKMTSGKLPVICFNSTGMIREPSTSSSLYLFIVEQIKGQGAATASNQYFERISFRKFTGRAELDISTLN
jgi:prepilin-type N-terminal cleavage/methylation domain-containing protein